MSVWKRFNGKRLKSGSKDYHKGIWQASGQFRGVQYKESIPLAQTKADAEDREQQIKASILTGEYGYDKRKTTFKEYVEKTYRPRMETLNASWEQNKKYQVERLLKYFGKYQLKLISRTLCERYRTKRKNETIPCQRCEKFKETCYLCEGEKPRYKPPCWKCRKRIELFKIHKIACKPEKISFSTVNRDMTTLSDILTDAVIDKEIKENPMRHVGKLVEPGPGERILRPDEKKRLFEVLNNSDSAISHRLKAIVLIALTTGWREGRIMAIKKEDLRFETRSVKVGKSKQSKEQIIPVSELTWDILTNLAGQVKKGPLFRDTRNGKPLKHFPRDSWEEVLSDAGIEGLTFHNLRATIGTEMILDGASLSEVQKTLDHKKVTTTQIYIRIAQNEMRNKLEKQSEKYQDYVE